MKTASEIFHEALRLKESGENAEPGKVLDLLTELARAVAELEHKGTADTEPISAEPADPK